MTRRAWAAGLLGLLMLACAVVIGLHWNANETVRCVQANVKPAATAPAVTYPSGDVDVNTADTAELETLSGISQSQIQALLSERAANGAFDYPEDLIYVKGIGEKTLVKIYDQLDFSWREAGD